MARLAIAGPSRIESQAIVKAARRQADRFGRKVANQRDDTRVSAISQRTIGDRFARDDDFATALLRPRITVDPPRCYVL